MKRFLLLIAITLMAIGQTVSARDWTVPPGSSATEAVFYVTLQDKDGANVKPIVDDFTLGAFIDGVCRGVGSAQYAPTTKSTCIFVFRIPVTDADADKTVDFALKIGDNTEYTISEVSGTSPISLTGGDQTVGYPSGSHKLLFTAPTSVKAIGDGIIEMDVYDSVNLADVLEFEPAGATVPDNYTVSVGNYVNVMSVENGVLTALQPNMPADFYQNITVEFSSNTTENPVMAEIPVAINNPIASITLKDASANSLTVPVNDSETTEKLVTLLTVTGKYAQADYTGQVFWTLKSGDAEGIDLVEGGTHVSPVKAGTYVLTANNEGGSITGVDVTLIVINPATGLTALYPNGIFVLQNSEMNQYLEYLYDIEPADATHGKADVTYTFSGTDDAGNEIFETLSYVGRGEITYAYGLGSGYVTVKHPDIEEPLTIPVTVVKGVPGPKEGVLDPLSIDVPADQIGSMDITDDLKAHVNETEIWGWDEFTWDSSNTSVVKPAVTYSGFLAADYGMTTITGYKTVTACGFDEETGKFNAMMEQTGNIMFDVTIVKGLSAISIEGFTIGMEDKNYVLTVTTTPADIVLDDAEMEFAIPTLADQQTPLFSLERVEGTNSWKVTPAYPGQGALVATYAKDFISEVTVTVSQHLTLEEGWSWVSIYAGSISLTSDFAESLQEARSQTALTYNDPQYGLFGDLNALDGSSAYKVNVKEGATFDYTVDNVRLYTNEATTVSLQPGWNWISNPCAKTHSFLEIFGKSELPEESRVVAQTGFMAYTTANGWNGSLESINAGEGYLIYNPGTTAISFEIQPDRMLSEYIASNEPNAAPARMRTTRSNMPELSYNPRRFADNMTIIASLPEEMDSERYTVVPFVGDECRGESKLINDRYFITVHGQKDEIVTFRVFDNQTGEYDNALNEMQFSTMAGSMKAPVILNASTSGIENITFDQLNQDGSDPIIYDMQGRRVGKDARGLLIVNGKKVFVK